LRTYQVAGTEYCGTILIQDIKIFTNARQNRLAEEYLYIDIRLLIIRAVKTIMVQANKIVTEFTVEFS
jgi:hypothetical protein